MSAGDAFGPLRSALERAGIRFAVGGSCASTAFGEPRFSNGVNSLAEFTAHGVVEFLRGLPEAFYVDPDAARESVERGRPFNVIHMLTAFKFDLFPAEAFPLGTEELDRAIWLAVTGLAKEPTPFVTPEDILLAKLHWFRLGGEVSEVQWRDIKGIVRACTATLDRAYLEQSAAKLGVRDLLERALAETSLMR